MTKDPWKWLLVGGAALFVLTRAITLLSFPIFNDEAIYLQYSQAIHADFSKYKFISEGGLYADWKPPLQYWIGAPFMGFVDDPLLAGRLAVFLVSLFGLWGLYLFVKELFGRREAALAVVVYALCPTALFFNIQFVAEAFVFSFAPWVYWAFLRAIRADKLRLWYAALAAVFGALLLLSKQSGMVYLGLAVLLPFAVLDRKGEHRPWREWNWKGFFIRLGVVAAGIVLAVVLRQFGTSAQSAQVEQNFNGNWLMGVKDLVALPWSTWQVNWESIRDYYWSYYSVFILLPLLYFFWIAAASWKRHFKDLVLALGFLAGSFAVLVLLKGFNEYIYNTAVIVFLVPMLARAVLEAWSRARTGAWHFARVAGAAVLASLVLLAVHWIYQDGLMKISPAGYIRRSTAWADHNYLENWSGGFGVAEAIAEVKTHESPGIILADPQWGNPRTALEVYNGEYPRLRVIGITIDFQTPAGTQAAKAYILAQPFKTRLVVFSTARNETRAVWQDNVEKYLCATRKEIQVQPTQPPIVVCSF